MAHGSNRLVYLSRFYWRLKHFDYLQGAPIDRGYSGDCGRGQQFVEGSSSQSGVALARLYTNSGHGWSPSTTTPYLYCQDVAGQISLRSGAEALIARGVLGEVLLFCLLEHNRRAGSGTATRE